jgi:hypothetical protein
VLRAARAGLFASRLSSPYAGIKTQETLRRYDIVSSHFNGLKSKGLLALALLCGVGVLACLGVSAGMNLGQVTKSANLLAALVLVIGAFVIGGLYALLMALHAGRDSAIGPAPEMGTLWFPPTPVADTTRRSNHLQRVK